MITVPDDFATTLGPEALAWRETLPALAREFCDRWRLTPDGPLLNGFVGVVLPVLRADGEPVALKLGWPHEENEHEALALKTWDGDGVVRLLDHDDERGALLLERLDHTRPLERAPLAEALAVAGGLLRRLRVPAGPEFRRHVPADLVARNAELGGPVPAAFAERATELGRDLAAAAGNTLVNEDLHYDNVLRGEREPWLVIDPKPLAGDPEFGLIPLLWNRFGEDDLHGRIAALCDLGGLDPDLARAWTFYRAVDNWLWVGEMHPDDPAAVSEHVARALW
ncbi:aminoglycoside phosphotransferase family protein [Saccharothrix syringae]|uniref:Aminoglycoside/hydroxyurea antibiotic resistance kinase n=1 Tax=Saccharothrix syringae TaxID=103733 RepID=A0A5Q0GRU6_SACSY|nr:aminoglycoside phosphotransferase family protein [Saccharothrix syringae]QFZ16787.1 aminoglycoside/hydroxyurea antibiotic resistance kinase [Saccharothrix syringae]